MAPGVKYAAWTYNGRVPGPTLRCREGERLRIRFGNGSSHPHTIHFHGIHPAFMDGMPGIGEGIGGGLISPGESFTYEFEAEPFGMHLYHCHATPLAEHIAKGLYGAFIVDPKQGREDADELVMVMNAFDTNFDFGNEVYAVNSIGFHYAHHPIKVKRGELVRIYLMNIVEFDPINSFHVHANFFHYFPTGTSLQPLEYTDTIMQAQGQRGILELRFPYRGRYMFHAHKTEFAELGWLGFFEVVLMEARGAVSPAPAAARVGAGADPAGADRRRDRRLRGARRARPGGAQRPAGRGAGGRADGASAGGDRADRPQRRARPGGDRPGVRQRRLRRLRGQRPGRSGRLGSTTIAIPYDWIEGEAYEIFLLTSTGGTVDHAIDVAAETPEADSGFYGLMALLGIYVGVIPVALGMLWLPFVRRIDLRWVQLLLALTIGLLAFLAIDAVQEGVDVAQAGPQALGGAGLVFVGALASYLLLAGVDGYMTGRRERAAARGPAPGGCIWRC